MVFPSSAMVTVNELYDRLGIAARNQRIAERAFRREERKREEGRETRVALHPGCYEHGHYPLGHTIKTTQSGKTYAICGRCKQGYQLPISSSDNA